MDSYPYIIPATPSYLEHGKTQTKSELCHSLLLRKGLLTTSQEFIIGNIKSNAKEL